MKFIRLILRWPRDPDNPARKYRNPWWKMAWRMFRIVPMFLCMFIVVIFAFIGWGPRAAKNLYYDMINA